MRLRSGPASPGDAPAGRPAPAFAMAKPRSLTWVQTLLWVFAAVAAVADLLSALIMARDFQPLSLAGLAYALYATVQSFITPAQIGRGKRWAWLWALASAVIGLVLSVGTTMVGMSLLGMAPGTVLFAAGVGVLYLVLVVLLCSKPVREWILMHRVLRGEVRVQGVPGPGMMLMAERSGAKRTPSRPRSLAWAQVLFWAVALTPLAWSVATPWAVGAAAALGGLALTSSVGLVRGRFWARVFTLVWVGAAGVAAGGAIAPGLLLATGTLGTNTVEMRTGTALALAFGLEFALACVAFGLMFASGVRHWTPPTELVMAYREAAPVIPPQPGAPAVSRAETLRPGTPVPGAAPPVQVEAPVPPAPAAAPAPAAPPAASPAAPAPSAAPPGNPPGPLRRPPHRPGPQWNPPGPPVPLCPPRHHHHHHHPVPPQRPPVPPRRGGQPPRR